MADYTGMSWAELEKLMYGHGKNFDKIAFDRLGNGKGTAKKLRQAFTTSFKKGESFDQLVKRIQKVTGAEANDAKRIARTESTRIESIAKDEAAHEYRKETGKQVWKIWFCSFRNSRDSHMALHMETVPLDDDFQAFGGPMAYPGDGSRVGPEDICNCQCWIEISKE